MFGLIRAKSLFFLSVFNRNAYVRSASTNRRDFLNSKIKNLHFPVLFAVKSSHKKDISTDILPYIKLPNLLLVKNVNDASQGENISVPIYKHTTLTKTNNLFAQLVRRRSQTKDIFASTRLFIKAKKNLYVIKMLSEGVQVEEGHAKSPVAEKHSKPSEL